MINRNTTYYSGIILFFVLLINYMSHYLRALGIESMANYLVAFSVGLLYLNIFVAFYIDRILKDYSSFNQRVYVALMVIFIVQLVISWAEVDITGRGSFHLQDLYSFGMILSGPIILQFVLRHNNSFSLFVGLGFLLSVIILQRSGSLGGVIEESRIRMSFELTGSEINNLVLNMASLVLISYCLAVTINCAALIRYFSVFNIGLSLIIGLYYTKRSQLIDVSAVILLTMLSLPFFKRCFRYKLMDLFAVVISVFLLIFTINFFSDIIILFDRVIDRISVNYEDIYGFDRFTEAEIWFAESRSINLIFGSGIGSYQEVLDFRNYHLHIGLINIVFKGGVLLAIVFATSLARNIIFSLKDRNNVYAGFVFIITAYGIVHLSHSPSWGWYSDSIIYGILLFSNEFLFKERRTISKNVDVAVNQKKEYLMAGSV
jgi:hypothetical protein